MTSDTDLERLVRPSDLHGRRRHRRRGWFGALGDLVAAALNAFVV